MIALVIGAGFIVSIVLVVLLFRMLLGTASNKLSVDSSPSNPLLKKFEDVDIYRYSVLFGLIGLTLSLGTILTAFEWKTYDEQEIVDLGTVQAEQEEVLDVPVVEIPPPPPPQQVVKQPVIEEVPDEEEIEDDIEVELDVEVEEDAVIEEIVDVEEEEEAEEVEQIFTVVEDPCAPIGGMQSFYKFITKKLKYPKKAKRMGVEGRVYVQFIVDKDGSITNVQVLKGISADCDEEAMRVIKMSPKWKPGKQRGRAVKQKMVVPIVFKLN